MPDQCSRIGQPCDRDALLDETAMLTRRVDELEFLMGAYSGRLTHALEGRAFTVIERAEFERILETLDLTDDRDLQGLKDRIEEAEVIVVRFAPKED